MNSEDKYLEAARLIAECKPSKLKYVLAVLEQGGFDLSKASDIMQRTAVMKKQEFLAVERVENGAGNWEDTDDPDITALRDAYKKGLNISKLSSASGIGRTTIYKFLAAPKPTSISTRDKLISALREIQNQ